MYFSSSKKLLKAFLIFFGLVVQATQAFGQCENKEVSFTFSYLSEDTVLLLNTTTGFDEYEWTLDGGRVISEFDRSLFVLQEADSLVVCLEATALDSCQKQLCQVLFHGHEEDICLLTDCVWPGDANGDRLANQYDLLNIGLGFGVSGPARAIHPVPHDPIFWAPSFTENWQHTLGPVNYKHFDCDGNGVIDEKDILAIEKNYAPAEQFNNPITPGAPSVRLDMESSIEYQGSSPAQVSITVDMLIGSNALPVADLHGMALRLSFPDQPFRFQQIQVNTEQSDFFSDDVLMVEKNISLAEKKDLFDFAITQKNTPGTGGFGQLVSFRIISADIIELISSPNTSFKVAVEGLLLINATGDTISYDLPADTTAINFIDNISSSSRPVQLDQSVVQLMPNPNDGSFVVQTQDDFQLRSYTVFNLSGQVLAFRKIDGNSIRVRLQDFRPGWYILKVQTNRGVVRKRVLLLK